MHTTTGKKLLTAAEYLQLFEQGVLTESDRVELIEGELVEKMTVGNRHAGRVGRLIHLFVDRFGDRVMVNAQSPVLLTDVSMPEPDLVILRARDDFYEASYAAPDDILLLVEVADTSLALDLRKARIYAAAAVTEYWLVNLRENVLQVYRQPTPQGYASVTILRQGDRVALAAVPEVELEVEDLVPTTAK
jgi:Uma2 family endonuclease